MLEPSFEYEDFAPKIMAFYKSLDPKDLAFINQSDAIMNRIPNNNLKGRLTGNKSLTAAELYVDLGIEIKAKNWRDAYVLFIVLKRALNF